MLLVLVEIFQQYHIIDTFGNMLLLHCVVIDWDLFNSLPLKVIIHIISNLNVVIIYLNQQNKCYPQRCQIVRKPQ